jgi:hypothetical protein
VTRARPPEASRAGAQLSIHPPNSLPAVIVAKLWTRLQAQRRVTSQTGATISVSFEQMASIELLGNHTHGRDEPRLATSGHGLFRVWTLFMSRMQLVVFLFVVFVACDADDLAARAALSFNSELATVPTWTRLLLLANALGLPKFSTILQPGATSNCPRLEPFHPSFWQLGRWLPTLLPSHSLSRPSFFGPDSLLVTAAH